MNFFKKRSTAWAVLLIVVVCSFFIGQSKRPADEIEILPSGVYIQDNANILSDSTEDYMTRLNNGLVSKLGAEIHVVTVNTTGGQDIFDTAIDVGVKTNLSANSCVFLIAADDTDAVIVQGDDLIYAFSDDELTYILQSNFTVEDFEDRTLDGPAVNTFDDLIYMYEEYYDVAIVGSNSVERVVTDDISFTAMAIIFFVLFILVLVLIVNAPRRRRTVIMPVGGMGRTVVPPPRPPRSSYNPPPRSPSGSRPSSSRTGGFGSSSRGGSFSSGSSSRGGSFSSSSRSSSSRSSFGSSSRSGGFGGGSRGGSFGGGSRGGGFRK